MSRKTPNSPNAHHDTPKPTLGLIPSLRNPLKNAVKLCPCTIHSEGYITNIINREQPMIFQIAFIFVAMGIFITLFAVLEILFLDYFLQQGAKAKRSRNVRNQFDK